MTPRAVPVDKTTLDLIRAAQAGDEDSLLELYRTTSSMVYTAALGMMASAELAETVTAATYVAIWRSQPPAETTAAGADGWLRRQTLRQALAIAGRAFRLA